MCNAGNQPEDTEAENVDVEKQEAEEKALSEQRKIRLAQEKKTLLRESVRLGSVPGVTRGATGVKRGFTY